MMEGVEKEGELIEGGKAGREEAWKGHSLCRMEERGASYNGQGKWGVIMWGNIVDWVDCVVDYAVG